LTVADLRDCVDIWRRACADLSRLARGIDELAWGFPTDLPGWSVHDVVAHCAALECELAGDPPLAADIDADAPHIRNPRGVYTEHGVVARRGYGKQQLIDEFEDAVRRRGALLDTEPLDDPAGTPPITPGDIDWDWQTLLRNRIVDIWVHDQDIRRAVGKPGDQDTPAAAFVQDVFGRAMPYVLAKRAGAPPGTSMVVDITGPVPAVYAVAVDDNGRGAPVDATDLEPTVRLTMSTEIFAMLAAGRRNPAELPVAVDGDAALADRVVRDMVVTW
jgi:uncharacterized protein (TIGR03083 family)